ncbi:hypothetical protein EDC02_6690 [Micromonospora sp. Llam0]|nr:hypothetical protein EDC02_6690 [Micromonospora sp. Llam0]
MPSSTKVRAGVGVSRSRLDPRWQRRTRWHGLDSLAARGASQRDGETIKMLIATVAGTAVASYLAGLLSFKIKSRWCPECGATTTDAIAKNVRKNL